MAIGATEATEITRGIMFFSLIFTSVGVVLSLILWSIGSFSNNYTQSVNGKKGFLIATSATVAIASAMVFVYVLLPAGSWLIPWAALGVAFGGLLFLLAAVWAARRLTATVRKLRADGNLSARLTLAVASLFIPSLVRTEWLAEVESYLHEAGPELRRAWMWDLVLKAPVVGFQLRQPVVAARVVTVGGQLADCGRDPVILRTTLRRALDAVLLSRVGYLLLSALPVLGIGATVWAEAGWFDIITNLDNFSVVAAATQAVLIPLRRDARRRRSVLSGLPLRAPPTWHRRASGSCL